MERIEHAGETRVGVIRRVDPAWVAADARVPVLGLVALTVYLPGVLTASVTARATEYGTSADKFTTDPVPLFAGILPTAVAPRYRLRPRPSNWRPFHRSRYPNRCRSAKPNACRWE